MKMCVTHWNKLREKISGKGLDYLVAQRGTLAAAQTADQIKTGEVTPENFDPLMHSYWSILGNAMETLERAGIDPLYLLVDGSNAPEGRNDCPVCELNFLHKQGCTNPECVLDKELGYDWMLERASQDAYEKARELKLVGAPS